MTQQISPALQAHFQQPYQTTCKLWYVARTDGQVFGFTDHDQDIRTPTLRFPVGSRVTYLADSGFTASDLVGSETLDVPNLEVQGMLNSPSITQDDLDAGLWDNAACVIMTVNWRDLTMGPKYDAAGPLGKVTIDRGKSVVELRGLAEAYTRVIGELMTPTCTANLGDIPAQYPGPRCKVKLLPPFWAATTAYAKASLYDANVGDTIQPTVSNRFYYRCTTAGVSGSSEPTWSVIVGGTTSDGTVVWTTTLALTVTSALTGVNPDTLTLYDSSLDEPGPTGGVTITGITNANPGVVTFTGVLDLAEGEAVTLSDLTSMPLLNAITVVRNPTTGTFELPLDTRSVATYGSFSGSGTVTPLGFESGFFDYGIITMLTGRNANLSREVKAYVPGQVTVWVPFPYVNETGDQYTMHRGCNKLKETCKSFNNIHNNRSNPDTPGIDQLVQIGSQT